MHRHASAGDRLDDEQRDRRRRLDRVGRADARGLVWTLGSIPVGGIVSSPLVRCTESVVPLARATGLDIVSDDALAPDAAIEEAEALLRSLPDDTLVCTHREVIERLFDGEVECEKGGTWVVEVGEHPRAVAYMPPASASVRAGRRRVVV